MKLKNILFTMISLLSFSLSSCSNSITVEQNIQYGLLERNYLDIAYPKNNATKAGLILYIHGGAWVVGEKETYEESIKAYAKKGFVCATMNYTYVSKDYSVYGILNEITNALTKIKSYTEDIGIEVNNAMLTGHSAGGHLSLLYGYSRPNESPIKVKCVAAGAPPTNLTDVNYQYKQDLGMSYDELFSWVCGYDCVNGNPIIANEMLAKASPVTYVNEDAVPTLLSYGLLDELIPTSNFEKLENLLLNNSDKHKVVAFPTSGHGLDKDKAKARETTKLFLEYANKYL
ncbi:MAG: alpha/beta hydrolase [Bacilli bacterium]|nr:alpha/beta hydrolase [Bacilli bacterium]